MVRSKIPVDNEEFAKKVCYNLFVNVRIKKEEIKPKKIYRQQIKLLLEQGASEEEIISIYAPVLMGNDVDEMIKDLRSKYYFKKIK